MLRFIGQRLVFIAVVCVAIVFLCFLGMSMVTNSDLADPDYDLIDKSGPAWANTQIFFSGVFAGDFGVYQSDADVPLAINDLLWDAYRNSLGLLLVALLGASVIGLYLGSVAALTRYRSLTAPLLTLTVVGIAVPSFFAGILLQQGAIRYSQEFGRRLVSMAGFGWDFQHMALPVLVLAARPLAYLTRAAFVGFDRIMIADFIRTARAKGLTRWRTVNIHALKNIAVPLLTAVGVSLRFSLSTLPVVEFFFAWPGMGMRLLEAINNRQPQLVAALAFVLGLTFLLINLLLDIAYRLLDPRLEAATE